MSAEAVLFGLLGAAKGGALAALIKKSGELAGIGTSTLIDWIVAYAGAHGQVLTGDERQQIEALLNEDKDAYSRITAQMQPADRRGILIVGPSGGGKTSLFNAMTNRTSKALKSSVEIDEDFIRLGGKVRAIRETPGQIQFGPHIYPAVQLYTPSTLILLVAYGYLDSIGTGDQLQRPLKSPKPTLADFLNEARVEEIEWIKVFTALADPPGPRRKVRHLLLAVNKMDLWGDEQADVMKYYHSDPFPQLLEGLVKKGIAVRNLRPEVVSVSSFYDAFKKIKAPVAGFDRTASEESVKLLKAFLASQMVDGNI
jgi:hypothetical protein